MNCLEEVEAEARKLMTLHGVGRLEFKFDRSRSRIGACHYKIIGGRWIPQSITLSRHFAVKMTSDKIREVMLHEIAHALTPGDHHGAAWKKKAASLGIKPSRCTNAEVDIPKAWQAVCRHCGKVQSAQHRAPLRVYACGAEGCVDLSFENRLLKWTKNGKPVPVEEMPKRFRAEHESITTK